MIRRLNISIVLSLLAAGFTAYAQDQVPAADRGWPRQTTNNGTTLVTHQPQVDEWKDFKTIRFRMAISITPKGGKSVPGAITVEAQTDVDSDNHMVLIHNLKIERAYFPSTKPEVAEQLEGQVREFLPRAVDISLERIAACTPKSEVATAVKLKNDPPKILVSYLPAVLLDVDGDPVWIPIKNTSLAYVMNTTWRLIQDKTDSRYYYLAGDQWLTTLTLAGKWTAASQLPKDFEVAVKDEHFADLKEFVPLPASKSGAIVPEVFYSTVPAEVIIFDGQPTYTSIKGTHLSYATNTASYVFAHAITKKVYYLTAGRWFSGDTLAGVWAFATPSLPEDFSRIPRSSPAAQVLASVPGTEESKDAVLMALIPVTAAVNPQAAAASAKATYDGEPKFAPIEGTSLQYATNTNDKVIKAGETYYLCAQGVWFLAETPQGPWKTAHTVPQEIYTIPASSPVYNVTYVTQNTLPSGEIEASYTSGYEGAYMMATTAGIVVAAGTGYYYPPYIGYYPGYYGYPPYYAYPYAYGSAAWYNSATGRYGVSQTAYGPYGSLTARAAYNPYTGTASRSVTAATPYGRVSAGRAYNPYTGAAAATRQGSNAYSQWGSSVVSKNGRSAYTQHYSDARGTVGTIQGSQGGAAIGAAGSGGNRGFVGKTGSGDMYAGRDGNLYRNTGSGWQTYDNGGWNSVNKPTPKDADRGSHQADRSTQTQNLRNESTSRQRGAESSQRLQQRSFGGGGRSFGGRRR